MGSLTKTRSLRLFGTPGQTRTGGLRIRRLTPYSFQLPEIILTYCNHYIIIFHIVADLSIF